jgi:outer membrane protein insertion porin family
MGKTRLSITVLLLFSVLWAAIAPLADEQEASLSRFYGLVIDSIIVSGNTKTKDYVLTREMESREGAPLDSLVFARDLRFLHDLGLFADISAEVDSTGDDGCVVHLKVKERSRYFLETILPVVNYDFDKGFSYGVRWSSRNFRGRRESLGASYIRSADNDDNVGFGWFAPWLGMRHIATGVGFWFFNRSDVPESSTILDQVGGSLYLGIPLTASRISFVQAIGRLAFERRSTGSTRGPIEKQQFLSPLLGIRADSRDSPLKPHRGNFFYLALQSWRTVSGREQTYYRLWNDIRVFRRLGRNSVLALLSSFNYQFGEFPEYSRINLGGSSTLRGYPAGEFSGSHLWFQTVESRFTLLPRRVFKLPFVKYVDVTIAGVLFVDSGIVWENEESFKAERFHGGAGFGLRIYSPFQDVVRLDLGFNSHGGVYPYVRTGIRF